jgi:hypothetical protein
MSRAAVEGSRRVLAAIAGASWTFERLALDDRNGSIALLISQDGKQAVATFTGRQADWISSTMRADVGAFTLAPQNGDGRIDLEITREGHACLVLAADHPSGEREILLPRSLSELWARAARQVRQRTQARKDGGE